MNLRCLKLYPAYSTSFNSLNADNSFFELNSKGQYQIQEKKKEVVVLWSRHFHVVVVKKRQRNVKKSVMHVQNRCLSNLNLLLFCRTLSRRRGRCLSSLRAHEAEGRIG